MDDFERARQEYLDDFNKRAKAKKDLDDWFRKKDEYGNVLEDDNEDIEEEGITKPEKSEVATDAPLTVKTQEATFNFLQKMSRATSAIKYTKFLHNAELTFKDTYNFNMLNENKNENNLTLLGFTVLFEEMRNSRKTPDEMKGIISAIHEKSILRPTLAPAGVDFVNIRMYETIYNVYNQYRIRGDFPAVAMIFAFHEAENNPVSTEEMAQIRHEYSINPIFKL